jgi:hypothetical protein
MSKTLTQELQSSSSFKETSSAEGAAVVDECLGRGRPSRSQFNVFQAIDRRAIATIFHHVITSIEIFFFPIVFLAAMTMGCGGQLASGCQFDSIPGLFYSSLQLRSFKCWLCKLCPSSGRYDRTSGSWTIFRLARYWRWLSEEMVMGSDHHHQLWIGWHAVCEHTRGDCNSGEEYFRSKFQTLDIGRRPS